MSTPKPAPAAIVCKAAERCPVADYCGEKGRCLGATTEGPIEPASARLVARLSASLVVIGCPRIHRFPQMFVRVKTRRADFCRVTATPIEKGAQAFAPVRRAAAYCYIRADVIEAAAVGRRLSLPL